MRHVFWKCSAEDSEYFIAQFEQIQSLYVADGHHRTAAATNVGKLHRERALAAGVEVTGEEPFNFFMTLFYPADNLLVMDYNRVIKDLNGLSANEFMDKLKEKFDVQPLADGESSKVEARHSFSLLLENKWHKMTLKPELLDCSTPVT